MTIAEVDVPSALAALLIASVPLILIVLRRATRRPAGARELRSASALGFVGVALLLLPGERPDGATLGGMLLLRRRRVDVGDGSFTASRICPARATRWSATPGRCCSAAR